MTTYRPYGNYILVQEEKQPEKSEGGIYYADAWREKANEGTILLLGPECKQDSLKVGDKIIFVRHSDYEFTDDDDKPEGEPPRGWKQPNYICVQETNVILCKSTIKEDPRQTKMFGFTNCDMHAWSGEGRCPHCQREYERDMNKTRDNDLSTGHNPGGR